MDQVYYSVEGFFDSSSSPLPAQDTLLQQRATVDSLLATAKRMNPIAKKVNQQEAAYDAEFESEVQAAQPKLGSTMQGFLLLFFIFCYVSLTIVTCIAVNTITESGTKAAIAFAMFLVLGLVIASLIIQFA